MQSLLVGGVAVLVGAVLAGATAFGVVQSASSGTYKPEGSVLQYGSTTK